MIFNVNLDEVSLIKYKIYLLHYVHKYIVVVVVVVVVVLVGDYILMAHHLN
jgi:hypothetical protein